MTDLNLYETSNLYWAAIIRHVRWHERGEDEPVREWWKSPVTGYVAWRFDDPDDCRDIVSRYEAKRYRLEPSAWIDTVNLMRQYRFREDS